MATPRRSPTAPIERTSVEPLYLQIAHRIAEQISDGHLLPGAKVSSEAELMLIHGVSRITARQALSLLARNGQVVAHRGKGTFVARPAVHHDLDALRGFQEALLRQGIEPQTELLEFSPSAGRTDSSLPAGFDLPVRLRRLYSVGGEPFAVVEAYLPAAAAAVGPERAKRLMVYDIVQQFLGLRIARADVVIRCARPGVERGRVLGVPAQSHVLVMERTSITTQGSPCEYMRIHIAPDRYAFRLSLPGPMEIARAVHPVADGTAPLSQSKRSNRSPA